MFLSQSYCRLRLECTSHMYYFRSTFIAFFSFLKFISIILCQYRKEQPEYSDKYSCQSYVVFNKILDCYFWIEYPNDLG